MRKETLRQLSSAGLRQVRGGIDWWEEEPVDPETADDYSGDCTAGGMQDTRYCRPG